MLSGKWQPLCLGLNVLISTKLNMLKITSTNGVDRGGQLTFCPHVTLLLNCLIKID